ncbi:hypothetical protein QE152_g40233 [Popillia japonica]|uniref:Uncharacterized protein n=1 Tax=Popillia japonica TaxID=7064 RepID=A0AAW1HRV4_POPJA
MDSNSNANVAFIKTQRKWIYADRFKINYTEHELLQFLENKFRTNNFNIEAFTKTDYYTKENYIAFKIGFPAEVEDVHLFEPSNWQLLNYNIQGLTNKIDALQLELQEQNMDILCLTEHFITKKKLKYLNITKLLAVNFNKARRNSNGND